VEEFTVNRSRIVFVKGDITQQKTDAIVNAANSSLMGGGGVDGAIHRAGGPRILEECKEIVKKIGRLPTGQAVVTSGGNLPAKFVIHTVGPIYREMKDKREEEGQEGLLRSCYIESLKLAVENGVKTISFPSISTGAYRYPLEEAAAVAVRAVGDFLAENTSIEKVYFVLFNDETYAAYLAAAQEMFSE
jgi:O-acetyl-ADP-ribose deacetylase (regulator of RNase III)